MRSSVYLLKQHPPLITQPPEARFRCSHAARYQTMSPVSNASYCCRKTCCRRANFQCHGVNYRCS
jgi:hypothetical protein